MTQPQESTPVATVPSTPKQMTYEELHARASIRGHVRWLKSGLIEQVKLSTRCPGAILAYSKFTDIHLLARGTKTKPVRAVYACEPCDPPSLETREAQRAIASRSKWYVKREGRPSRRA